MLIAVNDYLNRFNRVACRCGLDQCYMGVRIFLYDCATTESTYCDQNISARVVDLLSAAYLLGLPRSTM